MMNKIVNKETVSGSVMLGKTDEVVVKIKESTGSDLFMMSTFLHIDFIWHIKNLTIS